MRIRLTAVLGIAALVVAALATAPVGAQVRQFGLHAVGYDPEGFGYEIFLNGTASDSGGPRVGTGSAQIADLTGNYSYDGITLTCLTADRSGSSMAIRATGFTVGGEVLHIAITGTIKDVDGSQERGEGTFGFGLDPFGASVLSCDGWEVRSDPMTELFLTWVATV